MLSRYLYRGEIDGGQHESLSAFIIKRTNLSRSYVYQVLAALREGGYITVKKGKLILAGSPAELTEQSAGIAWSLIVPEREVGRYEAQCCICNLRHLTDGVELRIVSRNQPAPAAVPVQTTLEDLYLFHFADELGSDLSRPAGGKKK